MNFHLVSSRKGGSSYEYQDVPLEAWSAFSATFDKADASTGSHFHQHIKKFSFKKL